MLVQVSPEEESEENSFFRMFIELIFGNVFLDLEHS